jgi:hypothetical protein
MYKRFSHITLLALFSFLVFLNGCSSSIEDYAEAKPKFNLFEYFEGNTKAWGMVQDYSGHQIRRFEVDIVGTINGDKQLTLEEDFVYDDGETQKRIWTISQKEDGTYSGKAADVVGEAIGKEVGNALNWSYTLRVKTNKGEIDLSLDDWMFRHDEKRMFNRATMKKFGLEVGQITLFFEKE